MPTATTIALISAVLTPQANATPAIVTDTTIIVGANSPGPYFVSGFFIMSGSEVITSNSSVSVGHVLDYNTGRIVFERALAPEDSATAIFQRLGFALRSHWSLSANPDASAPPDVGIVPVTYYSPATPPTSTFSSFPAPSGLQWKGHKSFSITASEGQNSDWSQGLELGVEGELVRGLRLSAALSDRQVGQGSRYQSNGGSRLGDLDRLFIEAESQQFRGRWGELKLEQNGAASRRASGLQTRVRAKQHTIETFVARTRGEVRRSEITLREGILGPYPLSGTTVRSNIVSGSQAVRLDGNRLTEGVDADYTIDVARGTLSLSPRVAFSRQSQLVVEYEESVNDYQRTLSGGAWGWQSNDSTIQQSLSFAWEGDDPSRSIFGTITDEQRGILSNSASGIVKIPAAVRVGERDGDYNLSVSAGAGDSVFTYAGPNQGEWDVRFQWLGAGQGSYRYLIDNVYEYVGAGRGAYAPTQTLNAPAAVAVIDQSLRVASHRLGRLALDWQGLGIDPNRFSSGSSRVHSNYSARWALGNENNPRSSSASVNWIRQSERALTRNFGLALAQFTSEWRMRGDLLDQAYDSYSITSNANVAKWLTIRSDAERLDHARLNGWRNSSSVEMRPSDWLTLEQNYRQRWISSAQSNDSRTLQLRTRALAQSGLFSAEAGLNSEDVDDPSRQFTFKSDANISRWLALANNGFTLRQEWRRAHDIDLNRTDHTSELSLGLPSKLLGGASGSGLTALRGERSLSGGESRPYYGGRLNSGWTLRENLQIAADINLSHRNAGSQREAYIPTRPGQGDYRLDRGVYLQDPQGDFRRVFVDDESGDASAYDANKSIRVSWRPNWQGWRWTFDASRRIDARYSSSAFAPTDWLIPWTEMTSALFPGARLTLRDDHRISVVPRTQSRVNLLLVREHQLFRAADITRGDDDQRVWRVETEWREELNSKAYISATVQYHRRTREGSPLQTIDNDARALLTTIGVTPAPGVGLSVEGRCRLDREFAAGQSFVLWGIRPSTRVKVGALNGSITTDITWLDGDKTGYFSPLLSEGRPLGFSFTESVELRWQLPSRISLNARVYGDHRPNAPDRWRMNIETVATF